MDWLYSSNRFDIFRKELEGLTTWKYSGGSDLLLTNVFINTNVAEIDFTSTIICPLDEMKRKGAFPSVEEFFESIFRFAESADDSDPTWGFSDAKGRKIVGLSLKRVVLSLLPKNIGADVEKLEHFAVADVARR